MFKHSAVLLRLTFAIAFVWAVLWWPVRVLSANADTSWLTVAAVSCWLPGLIFAFLRVAGVAADPTRAAWLMMAIRASVVVAVVGVLRIYRPDAEFQNCYVWLILFYVVSLAVEVWEVRRELFFWETAEKDK